MTLYEFSIPMPYEIKYIDKVLDVNNSVKKSKITSFYFGLPPSNELYTGFEQCRNKNIEHKDFEYWRNLMEYSVKNGIDVIYCLNHPNPFNQSIEEYGRNEKKLQILLDKLYAIGIDKLRVANPSLMIQIWTRYREFKIYASTSLEYKTIQEYQNFMMMYPYTIQIVPSHDINKNFKLLAAIKKSLPAVEVELMATQACLRGCPHRTEHQSNKSYGMKFCFSLYQKNAALNICKANNIYPWDVEEYSKLGINKFKLVGRDSFPEKTDTLIHNYHLYMSGIDDYKNIENESINAFIHFIPAGQYFPDNIKVKDIKPLLPEIEYFKQRGFLCASDCRTECMYCYECASNINKMIKKKIN